MLEVTQNLTRVAEASGLTAICKNLILMHLNPLQMWFGYELQKSNFMCFVLFLLSRIPKMRAYPK